MRLIVDELSVLAEVFWKIPIEQIVTEELPEQQTLIQVTEKTMIPIPILLDTYKDMAALLSTMEGSETFIFPSAIIRSFVDMAERDKIELENKLYPPFSHMMCQLTKPIPEEEFSPKVEPTYLMGSKDIVAEDDYIAMVVISRDLSPIDGRWLNTVMAWYEPSKSVDRVAWWDSGVYNSDGDQSTAPPNKLRLRTIGTAMVRLMNSSNVEFRHVQPNKTMNARRRKKGKRELPGYYETVITPVHKEYSSLERRGKGTKHSFMYSVRGHFRRYRSGDTVWIGPHYRGLDNASMKLPKHVYRVKA